MSLSYGSVVIYYLLEQQFTEPRSYAGMLETLTSTSVRMFAVLTHLCCSCRSRTARRFIDRKLFLSALLDEGSGWLVRFVSPVFALAKIAGFLALQTSLAALIARAVGWCCGGTSASYRSGEEEEEEED
jgi:hypothetical protein